MATRNGEKHIRRQLESILNQLDRNDELIISDDSSIDRTVDIIKSFHDRRVILFEQNTFFSPIYNFENTLKKASCGIIALSDQDDIWLENKIDIVRSRLSDKIGRIYTIMMDGFVIDENDEIQEETLFQRVKARSGILTNIYDNCYTGCSMAFTKDLLKVAVPFPPNIPMHDSWFGILSEMLGQVEFVFEKTILYRRHPANASFRRRDVVQQVRWRYFLAYHLLRRYLAFKGVK